jgi:hypothetical protein
MKLHPLGLAKRRLWQQVRACYTAGTDAHLAAIKSLHRSAWECFEARKCDPPEQRDDYQYRSRQSQKTGVSFQPGRNQKSTVDPRVRKAILAVERDCERCWNELHRAIDAWDDGTRAKIRAIDALSKWQRDYHKRWDSWTARQKKLPTGIRKTQEFIKTHGQIHYAAFSDKVFATAKEAEREMQTSKEAIKFHEAMQDYNSPENQRLCELFDAGRFEELQIALDAIDAEDNQNDESQD